jgi:hypothetical protein
MRPITVLHANVNTPKDGEISLYLKRLLPFRQYEMLHYKYLIRNQDYW